MIAIEIVDENGGVLRAFEDPSVTHSLIRAATESSACLRFIDPYGDTTFNRLQLPVLLREIRDVAALARDPEEQTRLRLLADFVDTAIGWQPHVYVRFFGD